MNRAILLSLWVLLIINVFGQDNRGTTIPKNEEKDTKGKTYAVIIGISNYQNIHKLQYADRDARAFYDFLISKSGGSVDSANVKILLNKQAKRESMIRAITKWLMEEKKPRKGDRVYIYFAGHSDAIPGIDSWLLGWDVPNTGDPSVDYDQAGGIQIGILKRRILLMADSGVRVILITDACRGNELLSGGVTGRDYVTRELLANDMESKTGGLQYASCSSGEVSREDKSWGGGRGLFSYWLINGLYGMADKDSDGFVSAGELREYVAENVKTATSRIDASGKRIYDQNPFYCCTENDNDVIAVVDTKKKQEIAQWIKSNEGDEGLIASIAGRGFSGTLSKLTDTVRALYNSFEDEIQQDASADYEWEKYLFTYNLLERQPMPDEFGNNIKEDLAIALFNHSQQAMNLYLEHGKNQSSIFWRITFSDAVFCLDTALSLVDKMDELYAKIKRNRWILEAAASTKYYDELIPIALHDLDTVRSLNHKPSAVVSHIYGLLYLILGKDSEGIVNDLEANRIAPRWLFPLNSLGNLYQHLKEYNIAEGYFLKALQLDSNYVDGLSNLGYNYYLQKQYDQAEKCYHRALQVDSTRTDIMLRLGEIYFRKVNDNGK